MLWLQMVVDLLASYQSFSQVCISYHILGYMKCVSLCLPCYCCDKPQNYNLTDPPSFAFLAEYPDYQPAGEEIIVPDMHTRKKMMFDKVGLRCLIA